MNLKIASVAIAAAGLMLGIAPAFAQNARTFVSGLGSDSNPCSRTSPCRTFAQAISVTNAGGEISVLDSAGYGAFTINKAISIIAPVGVDAEITQASGNAITITASGSVLVILNGLTLTGSGTGGIGIDVTSSSAQVSVINCNITGFTSAGIDDASAGQLLVQGGIIDNGNGSAASGTAIINQRHYNGQRNGCFRRCDGHLGRGRHPNRRQSHRGQHNGRQ